MIFLKIVVISKEVDMTKIMKIFFSLFIFFFIVGCKPEEMKTEVYVGDLQAVVENNEIIEVPISAAFSLLGEDKDNLIPRAVEALKPYVHPDTEFSQSKGMFGDRLVIDSVIPIGTRDAINTYLSQNPAPFVIDVSQYDNGDFEVTFFRTSSVEEIDKELSRLNMMLGFDPVANDMLFRVVNDTRDTANVSATAVFVSEKPNLYFDRDIERRDAVEILFKGGSASVYSEIAPQIYIALIKN
jgi:hypothetical protein